MAASSGEVGFKAAICAQLIRELRPPVRLESPSSTPVVTEFASAEPLEGEARRITPAIEFRNGVKLDVDLPTPPTNASLCIKPRSYHENWISYQEKMIAGTLHQSNLLLELGFRPYYAQ